MCYKNILKYFSLFLIIIIPTIILTYSCKDDGPVPFSLTETGMYFHAYVDDVEKVMVEGSNGYQPRYIDSCRIDTASDDTSWTSILNFDQNPLTYNILNNEGISIVIHRLPYASYEKFGNTLQSYFNNMPFAYIDTLTGPSDNFHGIEIKWTDRYKDAYSTVNINNPLNLRFSRYSAERTLYGYRIHAEANFSCNLYNRNSKETISIKDAEVRVSFNVSYCY